MVRLLAICYQASRNADKVSKFRKRKFVDSLRLFVKGGTGGMGYPKYGGIGGKGGDVYVEASDKLSDMKSILKELPLQRLTAKSGGNSRLHRILGETGKDVKAFCPTGITVYNDLGHKIGELNENGEKLLVARGGPGGNPINQFNGQPGQSCTIKLDLKLIADIGLVGYPNAGKSSLLQVISNAKPRIANYPFTTLSPQIGIVNYPDLRQISVADLPGLIEGAHANIGLGHHFLKHVERTKLLLFVIDINGFQLSPVHQHRSAFESVALLIKELELYKEELLDKPAILVVNKMDTERATELNEELMNLLKNAKDVLASWPDNIRPKHFIEFDEIIATSMVTEEKIEFLKEKLRNAIDVNTELQREDETIKDIDILVKTKPSVQLI